MKITNIPIYMAYNFVYREWVVHLLYLHIYKLSVIVGSVFIRKYSDMSSIYTSIGFMFVTLETFIHTFLLLFSQTHVNAILSKNLYKFYRAESVLVTHKKAFNKGEYYVI